MDWVRSAVDVPFWPCKPLRAELMQGCLDTLHLLPEPPRFFDFTLPSSWVPLLAPVPHIVCPPSEEVRTAVSCTLPRLSLKSRHSYLPEEHTVITEDPATPQIPAASPSYESSPSPS